MTILMLPDYRGVNAYQQLLADSLRALGVEVSFLDGYRRVFPITRGLPQPLPDVAHLHWINAYIRGTSALQRSVYAAKFLLDVRLAQARGVRVVWTLHNLQSHDTPFPGIDQWARRQLVQRVDAIIVHDPGTRDRAIHDLNAPPDSVTVVPHGHYRSLYDAPPDASTARRELGLPLDAHRLFLHLGIIRPYKGIDDLLDAWPQHLQAHPDDHLAVAGKPLDEAYGRSLQQKAASLDQVDLRLGYVDDDDIPLYFGAADVSVLPFRKITTSGSLVLAASFGLPIVAPRYPGLEFVLETADDLLYGPPSTVASLVDALSQASQADIRELCERTKHDCDRLDWSRVAERTRSVYVGGSGTIFDGAI